MHPLTVKQLCEITAGIAVGPVNLNALIDGCVIDSRDVQAGDAFFALSGSSQHGVTFAANALRDGAVAVIVDQDVSSKCEVPHIAVEDAEIALAQLANHNRRQSDALVIGITGSVGKTTARGMIASVLESVHTGIQSPRNFNNHLGVPLSLLELQQGDEFGVIEIASAGPGEVTVLASVTEPEFVVVTRVTPAHLRGFGSLQSVQSDKQSLVQAAPEDGVAFLNADDPLVAAMSQVAKCRVVTFGKNPSADVCATEISAGNGRLSAVVDGIEYSVGICGEHNITNLLAAIAVGQEVGVSPQDIQAGLDRFVPQQGRCQISSIGPWTAVDDTYNASPASVTAAAKVLNEFPSCRHRIMVLGDMLDLGEQAADLHYGVGSSLASSAVDHVLVMGDFCSDVADGFLAAGGHQNRISVVRDLSHLQTVLDLILSDGDVVLVKGSRATRMDRVITWLSTQSTETQPELRRAA